MFMFTFTYYDYAGGPVFVLLVAAGLSSGSRFGLVQSAVQSPVPAVGNRFGLAQSAVSAAGPVPGPRSSLAPERRLRKVSREEAIEKLARY